MNEEGTPETDTPTASLAAEIRQETKALTSLLGKYASKAEVTKQLADERETTKELVKQRDNNRRLAFAGVALGAIFAVVVSLWALNVSHDSKQAVSIATATAAEANATAKKANDALLASKAAEEQQRVVSCNDSNQNRAALLGLFDFIDDAINKAEAAGAPVSQGSKDLVVFGHKQFAIRDCTAEAAARVVTPTTQPGG